MALNQKRNIAFMSLQHTFPLLIVFYLCSCSGPNRENASIKEINTEDFGERLMEEMTSLPDTVLVSKNIDSNEYELDLSEFSINREETSLLSGEWIITEGRMDIHYAHLDINDVLIFSDSKSVTMSGWGLIRYNRKVRVKNYDYEYFIDNGKSLKFIRFNYRDENNTVTDEIEPVFESFNIESINSSSCVLEYDGGVKIILKKKISTANNG